jgi:glycerophosphoryl diester phosphodiesterase
MSRERGRSVGVYPETKHPSYFRSLGLPLEEPLVAALEAHGEHGPVYIQSFEASSLRRLREGTSHPLIQLIDLAGGPWDRVAAGEAVTFADLVSPEELRMIADYAAGIGPHKRLIIPEQPDGALGRPTSLIADAHAVGLLVHPWTFRSDPGFLHGEYGGDPAREIRQFRDLGADGLFCDFPDVARTAINAAT